MSPRVPEAYLEARRNEILEAAVKCFMEKGFHNTTMQDIYQVTNLSPGVVYNYFSSKEEIIIAALKSYQDWSISQLTDLISKNPQESIAKILQFYLTLIVQSDSNKSFAMDLDFFSEAIRSPGIREVMLKSMDATHAALIELITHNQQAGRINSDLDPVAIARVIMSLVFGIALHKSLNPAVDMDAFRLVCEAMINGDFSKTDRR